MIVETNSNKLTDAQLDQLIRRIAEGDRSALAALYSATSTSIYAFILSMLKNVQDAEDVLQNSYIHVYRAASSYKRRGRPMGWLITIARNLCFDRLREREKSGELKDEDWDRYLTEEKGIPYEQKLILENCMMQLSDEERQIVVLHTVSGFKHREIADITGQKVSTCLSKYNRAIKKLRLMMEEER